MSGRLCFLITDLDYGGAETQLVRLAGRLRERGWEVSVISMMPAEAYQEELAAAGIALCSLGMRRGVPDPRAIWRLARRVQERQPDVLHSMMVHANLLARVTRLVCHTPVLVCTVQNDYEGGRWRPLAYRLTDRLCDLTTHVSPGGLELFVQVGAAPRARIRFLPNGVDSACFAPDAAARERLRAKHGLEGKFVWMAVGRFQAQKDHDTMVRAFAQGAAERPEAVLVLVGQGELEPQVRARTDELDLGKRVQFWGLRRDVPACLNAADAYLLSSAWEGMPVVLLEAGATGLPAAATEVGANRQVVREGETGFLAPPRDPAALAQAMGRIMDMSEPARAEMGARARQWVQEAYGLEQVVDQWEALYRELAASKRRA